VYVPHYHDARSPWGADVWAMGSTYERGVDDAQVTPQGHARNAESLAAMDAAAHQRLQAQAQASQLVGWAQVRCASADRLPLVGAVPAPGPRHAHRSLDEVPRVPGLWTVCAFGSRGLTLALLAAHTLAARMHHEPLPVPRAQADALDPARFWWKHGRLPR
jgi:tRNA 5-methylaminomethyl-2-thiouridine biosynthesis bifunctional protein